MCVTSLEGSNYLLFMNKKGFVYKPVCLIVCVSRCIFQLPYVSFKYISYIYYVLCCVTFALAGASILIGWCTTEYRLQKRELKYQFCAINKKQINARNARLQKDTEPGPDGIPKRHIMRTSFKEVTRLLINLILISKIQPSACSFKRTILIPKQ
jgi:hypothetical protein